MCRYFCFCPMGLWDKKKKKCECFKSNGKKLFHLSKMLHKPNNCVKF